jgi:transposase InsO family protein
MPWKELTVMDERLRFVSRLLEGEQMALMCREFGISRKTGYKIFDRYKEHGLEALTDRSRRPYRYANKLPAQVERTVVGLKQEKPHWGARKIREKLLRKFANEVKVPAVSTIHAVLDRHGLITHMKRRPWSKANGTGLSLGQNPNELWCTDYKGEFLLGNHKYCYPLTVTDHASRYLLLCEAMESTREDLAFTAFERLFKERGLPGSIRSDNGVPFASVVHQPVLRLPVGIEEPFRRHVGRLHRRCGQHAAGQQCDTNRTDASCHECLPLRCAPLRCDDGLATIYITWDAVSAVAAHQFGSDRSRSGLGLVQHCFGTIDPKPPPKEAYGLRLNLRPLQAEHEQH